LKHSTSLIQSKAKISCCFNSLVAHFLHQALVWQLGSPKYETKHTKIALLTEPRSHFDAWNVMLIQYTKYSQMVTHRANHSKGWDAKPPAWTIELDGR